MYKKRATQLCLSHNLVFVFQVENGLHGKKLKHWIAQYATNFLQSFTICLVNNEFLNKYYWDDRDSINQGQSKGNVPQFCSYIDYSWTDFN